MGRGFFIGAPEPQIRSRSCRHLRDSMLLFGLAGGRGFFAPHAGSEGAEGPPLQLGAVNASVRDVLVYLFLVVAVVIIARVLSLRWCLLCGVGLLRCVFVGRRFVLVRGGGRATGCSGRLCRGLVGRFGLGDRAGFGIGVVISAGSKRADDCHSGCYSHDFPTNGVGVFASVR